MVLWRVGAGAMGRGLLPLSLMGVAASPLVIVSSPAPRLEALGLVLQETTGQQHRAAAGGRQL